MISGCRGEREGAMPQDISVRVYHVYMQKNGCAFTTPGE